MPKPAHMEKSSQRLRCASICLVNKMIIWGFWFLICNEQHNPGWRVILLKGTLPQVTSNTTLSARWPSWEQFRGPGPGL